MTELTGSEKTPILKPPYPRRRAFSVRHARRLEILYTAFERFLIALHPLFRLIGYKSVAKPILWIEKPVKKLLFDCQMCGQCALSSTGMSCPTNCPKSIRNGPCGGVRADGNCEVEPEMACVWVQAWSGAQTMRQNQDLSTLNGPIDHRLWDQSSWLLVAKEKAEAHGSEPLPRE